MRRAGILFAALLCSGFVRDDDPLLELEARLSPGGTAGAGVLLLDARLPPGWHVNSHKPSEDYLIPTAARCDESPSARCGPPRYPQPVTRKFSFSKTPLSVYEESFTIEIPLQWQGAEPVVSGTLEYQACNDRQCNPPVSARFRAGGPAGTAPLAGGAVPLSAAPSGAREAPAAGASRDFGELLDRRGMAVVLFLLFAGGLALNLTPCVYPVIPLTIGYFGGQSAGGSRHVFRLAALYVLGMATMYSALGVAAALSGRLFGVALQSPWVLSGVATVLVLLSLSMFGLYDLRMPSFLMQKTGARAGGAGAYAMGLLVGIVAAPCVGPFVLGLLAFVAARQSAALGFLFFFVLSLGLGLPYLFLGAFSGSLARLPRAGEWMNGVKKVFGWVLLAMAAYFLRTVVPEPLGSVLLPLVLGAAAIGILIRGRPLLPALRAGLAVLFVAAALWFAPRRLSAADQPDWKPYASEAVARAGRPAVLDFSADWCIPCRELDEKTFSDPRVRERLEQRSLFKADMTKAADADVLRLAEQYAILGVPTIVFLDATGRERTDLRLVGFENAERFLERLAKAP